MSDSFAVQTSPPSAGPLHPGERADWMDAARGLAICGIAFMNVRNFAGVNDGYLDFTLHPAGGNLARICWAAQSVLADTKFITLFSLLFGIGLAMQSARGVNEARFFRRFAWLCAIGAAHVLLLWGGDILLMYGLIGMLACLLRHEPPAPLLTYAVCGIVATEVLVAIGGLAVMNELESVTSAPAELAAELAAMRGTYFEHWRFRIDADVTQQFGQLIAYGPRTFSMMLLGMAAWKADWVTHEGVQVSKRWLWVLALAGLSIASIYAVLDEKIAHSPAFTNAFGRLIQDAASLLTVLPYLALGCVLSRGLARPIVAVGRTALSCYLLQTLLFTMLFGGYGLGYAGRLNVWQQCVSATVVCLICTVLANLWLWRFARGPMEQLWRGLTYRNASPRINAA